METKFQKMIKERSEYRQLVAAGDISEFEKDNLECKIGHLSFGIRSTRVALSFVNDYLPKMININDEHIKQLSLSVEDTDPYTNGFDIHDEQHKVLVEVKAFDNMGSESGMRGKSARKDIENLLGGKKKAHIEDTSDYYKFFTVNDRGDIRNRVCKIASKFDNVLIYEQGMTVDKEHVYVVFIENL